MNPYEPPQTTDPELSRAKQEDATSSVEWLLPVASEVHLEELSIRTLAEFTAKMVLASRLGLAVLMTAFVLVAVTWFLYQPQHNPIWVTVVLLNCASIGSVLLVWRFIETNTACSYLMSKLIDPEHLLIVQRCIGSSWVGCFVFFSCVPLSFKVLSNGDIQLLIIPMVALIIVLITQEFCHYPLIKLLRAFLAEHKRLLDSQKLRILRWVGSSLVCVLLVVMAVQLLLNSTPWGWLLLSLASVMLCLWPTCRAYHQLAQELDKLWP
jgi:hypothetical protein